MRLSEKLGALCAGAAILPLLVASLVVLSQLSSHARRQANEDLQRDARAAAAIYDKRLSELRWAAQRLADDIVNRAFVKSDSAANTNATMTLPRLQDMLQRALQEYGLDFAIVADTQGTLIARHNDRPAPAERLTDSENKNALAERLLSSGGQALAAAAIERGTRLQTLGLDLHAQVKLINGATVDEALMIEAAAPIQGGGRAVGIVLIGQMINNDSRPRPGATTLQTPLVAEIRQTLYRNMEEEAGAVVAYQNAIIASSVAGATGSETASALMGELCDTTQNDEVVEQGNERYAIAWQSIKALDGADVGRLGAARNARVLAGATATVRMTLLLIAAIAVLLAGVGGYFYGRALGLRLEGLNEAVTRWSVGELSIPAKDRDPMMMRWVAGFSLRDEISRLAASLEQMRESFRQAIDRMRRR
jgi:HAMP domain-containing protein